jgi:hypothetical protein
MALRLRRLGRSAVAREGGMKILNAYLYHENKGMQYKER